MTKTDSATTEPQLEEIPPGAPVLGSLLGPLNHFFDAIYSSAFNPLYRSGTLAVACLIILLVSGTYLLLFYSVSEPYESVQAIDQSLPLGWWIRSIHRYATDVAVFAVVFHIIQLLFQGKTWGPRVLAWISGVVLLGFLLLSAWSGYVMVWDRHAQAVASYGAQLLVVPLPFLEGTVNAAFDGRSDIAPAFFFMNLFLHVALPLLMFFGLWVHTSKLARTVWFPSRRIFAWLIAAISAAALFAPAPLMKKADLAELLGVYRYDGFVNFWLPLAERSNVLAFTLLTGLAAALFLAPWIWRPRRFDVRPRSQVDADRCTGCTQCVQDCPYEAITMVPNREGKRLLAVVEPASCVSCGICAASCADLAIGPPGRSAQDQIDRAHGFADGTVEAGGIPRIVAISCIANAGVSDDLRRAAAEDPAIGIYPVDCCGALHSEAIEILLNSSAGLFIIGCPARNCRNRDGLDLLSGRMFERRVPFVDRSIDRRRIAVWECSGQERGEFLPALKRFSESFANGNTDAGSQTLRCAAAETGISVVEQNGAKIKRKTSVALFVFRSAGRLTFTGCLLALMVTLSKLPAGSQAHNGVLRIAARLPAQMKENCRAPTPEEISKTPIHMRTPQICESVLLRYQLQLSIDGKELEDSRAVSYGGSKDRPIHLDRDVPIVAGSHRIKIRLLAFSEGADLSTGGEEEEAVEYEETTGVEPGEIHIVVYNSSDKTFSRPVEK